LELEQISQIVYILNSVMHYIYIKDWMPNKTHPRAVHEMYYLCKLHAEVLTQILMVKCKLD